MSEIDDITFLTVEQAIALHREAIARISPGEPMTVLEPGRVESAVLAVQQSFGGQSLYSTIEEMAAGYLFGLAQNHPFENGNKRVAFAACSVFLNMNGYCLDVPDDEAEGLVIDMICKNIDRESVARAIRRLMKPVT